MRRAQHGTIFDSLRMELSHNGAIKSPTPQSERPVADNSVHAAMDTSGIGQASTGGWPSRHYAGGGLTPQAYMRPPADLEDQLADAGKVMNARAALPNRGLTPSSPLARRR